MSTLRVDNITDTSGGSSSLSVPGAAKAWVNFNGTGTVAIRAQLNVSSITDNGVGNYTVNFATALPDNDYAVSISSTIRSNATSILQNGIRSTALNWESGEGAMLTTSVQVFNRSSSATDVDPDVVCVSIFR